MPKIVEEVLTVLSHRTGSVDQSGGQRGDYEPFALELGRIPEPIDESEGRRKTVNSIHVSG